MRRQPHVPHSLDLQREWESARKVGNETSGVADEISVVRATERRKQRSRESDGVEIYSKILNFDQIYIYIEEYDA
jgi:hypothetical protein